VSKQELKMRTWTAAITSLAAGLLIAGTVARVSNGLAAGEHVHIPLAGLALVVALLILAIFSILAWLRAIRNRV
jgi:ABC-type transport system involved in cytochrome bd biosynthesis fused ATPase/permease subunit